MPAPTGVKKSIAKKKDKNPFEDKPFVATGPEHQKGWETAFQAAIQINQMTSVDLLAVFKDMDKESMQKIVQDLTTGKAHIHDKLKAVALTIPQIKTMRYITEQNEDAIEKY